MPRVGINDLLDLSRVARGNFIVRLLSVVLGAPVDRAPVDCAPVDRAATETHEKNISLAFEPPKKQRSASGDFVRRAGVFSNRINCVCGHLVSTHSHSRHRRGHKHDQPDNRRPDRRDQHRTGRHILAVFDQGMKFRRSKIAQQFHGRIQRLGRPNADDRQDQSAPLNRGNMKNKSHRNDHRRDEQMNPRIMLRNKNQPDSGDGVGKTFESGGNVECIRGRLC